MRTKRDLLVRSALLVTMTVTFTRVGTSLVGMVADEQPVQVPRVTIRSTTPTAFEDGPSNGVFTISRDGSTAELLTVRLSIGGSATDGVDYEHILPQVQIPAGKPSINIAVKPIDDTQVEDDENVTIGLADAPIQSTIDQTLASVVIKDNDTIVRISTSNAHGSENGPTPIVFNVTRNGNSRAALTISYAVIRDASTQSTRTTSISDGTSNTIQLGQSSTAPTNISPATSGLDYITPPGTLTLQIGESSKAINVMPIDDLIPEELESVTIQLLPSRVYTVAAGASTATGYIEDNDRSLAMSGSQLPVVTLTASQPNAAEDGPAGSTTQVTLGTITVTRTGPFTSPLTVLFSVNDPTLGVVNAATNGVDFERLSGEIIIPAGASTATITIRPLHDSVTEPEELVVIQLIATTPQTYALQKGATQATVKIKDHQP